jgi:teichuronic acid biosynthesis glycosyltransferase TuaC
MKWLLFTSLFPTQTAPDSGLFNLARVQALRKAGNDVSVIVPNDLTPHLRYIFKNLSHSTIKKQLFSRFNIPLKDTIDEIPVYHPKWYSPPRSMFWKDEYKWLHLLCGEKIDRIISHEKPDIIICSWLSPFGTYAKYFKARFNIPVFLIPEGDDLLIYPNKYSGWNIVKEILNTYCERIICSSKFMFEQASLKYGLKNSVRISNGYDHEKFFYIEKNPITKGKINLICVGYMDYVKGQDILIQAMTKLDKRFELTLIGNGTLRLKLEQMVRDLKLEKRVFFIGFKAPEKLASFYHAADIFCLASRSEGFGISILEAMACGLPVVGSDAGGIPEKIITGKNGYIAQAENVNDFAEKIKKASETKWDHDWIAAQVQNDYNWEKWVHEMTLQFNEVKKER